MRKLRNQPSPEVEKTTEWEKIHKQEEALLRHIERYVRLTLRNAALERLQKGEQILDDRERFELHAILRSEALALGIDDDKLTKLMDLRVRDEMAQYEIAPLSDRAGKILGVPVTVSDNELIYHGGTLEMSNQPDPRYTICFTSSHSRAEKPGYYLERDLQAGDKEPHLKYEDIQRIENILKMTCAELAQSGVTYAEHGGHAGHHADYQGWDDMAWWYSSMTLSFPKDRVREVFQILEKIAASQQKKE